jgi:hypothetical protein
MDSDKKKRLASKVAERRAASFARLKKSAKFKAFTHAKHEEHMNPPRKQARA